MNPSSLVSAPAHAGTQTATSNDPSPARRIAAFAANLRYEDVPARVQAFAKHHLLDTLGTTLAATHFDFAHRALSGANATGESGHSTVIGMAALLALSIAVNATIASAEIFIRSPASRFFS